MATIRGDVQSIVLWLIAHINFHLNVGLHNYASVEAVLTLVIHKLIIILRSVDIILTIFVKYLVLNDENHARLRPKSKAYYF